MDTPDFAQPARRILPRERGRMRFPGLDSARDMDALADAVEDNVFPALPPEYHNGARALIWQVVGDAWYLGYSQRRDEES